MPCYCENIFFSCIIGNALMAQTTIPAINSYSVESNKNIDLKFPSK